MVFFSFFPLQKKEPVGTDESVPESAQNLDELTADILGVSPAPAPRCFHPGLRLSLPKLAV